MSQEPVEPKASQVETPPAAPAANAREMEEGKTFAILSYVLSFIGLPFFLVPLIMRNNEFSLYHAKQCLMLWICGIAVSVASTILMVICIGIVLAIVGGLALLVFNVLGLMNAVKGQMKPLPLIGKWGEEWFKGLKKA